MQACLEILYRFVGSTSIKTNHSFEILLVVVVAACGEFQNAEFRNTGRCLRMAAVSPGCLFDLFSTHDRQLHRTMWHTRPLKYASSSLTFKRKSIGPRIGHARPRHGHVHRWWDSQTVSLQVLPVWEPQLSLWCQVLLFTRLLEKNLIKKGTWTLLN